MNNNIILQEGELIARILSLNELTIKNDSNRKFKYEDNYNPSNIKENKIVSSLLSKIEFISNYHDGSKFLCLVIDPIFYKSSVLQKYLSEHFVGVSFRFYDFPNTIEQYNHKGDTDWFNVDAKNFYNKELENLFLICDFDDIENFNFAMQIQESWCLELKPKKSLLKIKFSDQIDNKNYLWGTVFWKLWSNPRNDVNYLVPSKKQNNWDIKDYRFQCIYHNEKDRNVKDWMNPFLETIEDVSNELSTDFDSIATTLILSSYLKRFQYLRDEPSFLEKYTILFFKDIVEKADLSERELIIKLSETSNPKKTPTKSPRRKSRV